MRVKGLEEPNSMILFLITIEQEIFRKIPLHMGIKKNHSNLNESEIENTHSHGDQKLAAKSFLWPVSGPGEFLYKI